jgi:8-oxo-dGTP pyrophosphatase MutT (NUDIX family)
MTSYTKVVAYITRESPHGQELLVFEHRDNPEAGTQVPAGTVEAGEEIADALRREVLEETGLSDLPVVRKIATYEWVHPISGNTHERHVFHLTAPSDTADTWEWLETSGTEGPNVEGYVFQFRWVPLQGEIDLVGDFGAYLSAIR